MPIEYCLYSGNETEALTKANAAIALINEKCNEIASSNWVDHAQRLTADPEIEGTVYLYGFQAPPPIFVNGSTCDLQTEFSSDWFVQND